MTKRLKALQDFSGPAGRHNRGDVFATSAEHAKGLIEGGHAEETDDLPIGSPTAINMESGRASATARVQVPATPAAKKTVAKTPAKKAAKRG